MVEGGSELIHLLLGDALCISRQDLGLHLVDGSGDRRQQQLPAHTDVLPRKTENDQLQILPAGQFRLLIFITGESIQRETNRTSICFFLKFYFSALFQESVVGNTQK